MRQPMMPALLAVVVLLGACGVADNRGVELGHLRDLARRVEGGGVECPLAIPHAALRPAGVDADAPVLPLRQGGPGSDGVIGGDDLPGEDSVKIMCRWSIQDRAVILEVIGVKGEHAIASFDLAERGDTADVLDFLEVNARLPLGEAIVLPGDPPAAFSRVRASHGDVALVLTVDAETDRVTLPDDDQLEQMAVGIAHALAD